MKEEFCIYDIALKLKELGFVEECFGFFESTTSVVYPFMNCNNGGAVAAPLWQQVIDWLETKGYYINVTRVFQWNPLPVKFSGWCIYIGTENPKETLECNSYYVSHYYPTKQEAYEQAILKGLEICQTKKQSTQNL